MKKKLLISAVLCSALMLFGACGSGDAEKKTTGGNENTLNLSVWNYDTTPEFQLLVEEFKKENPDVKVNLIDAPSADYQTKITTMLSSGEALDVVGLPGIATYGSFAYLDQLEDITDHVTDAFESDNYNGSIEEYRTSDDKLYAAPYRHDMYVMYYNKDVFDEAGLPYPDKITWDQYEAYAKQLTNKESGLYGAYNHYWFALGLGMSACQNEKDIFAPSYQYAADHYDRLLRMQKEGSILEYGTIKTTKTTYYSQFETEKTAMLPIQWVPGPPRLL